MLDDLAPLRIGLLYISGGIPSLKCIQIVLEGPTVPDGMQLFFLKLSTSWTESGQWALQRCLKWKRKSAHHPFQRQIRSHILVENHSTCDLVWRTIRNLLLHLPGHHAELAADIHAEHHGWHLKTFLDMWSGQVASRTVGSLLVFSGEHSAYFHLLFFRFLLSISFQFAVSTGPVIGPRHSWDKMWKTFRTAVPCLFCFKLSTYTTVIVYLLPGSWLGESQGFMLFLTVCSWRGHGGFWGNTRMVGQHEHWWVWVISKFNGTSTPKGSSSAKTGLNCQVTSLKKVQQWTR